MWCFPKRYLIAVLTCLGFILITFLRNASENKLKQFFHIERQNPHLPSNYFFCELTFSIGQLTSLVGGIISNRNGGAVAFSVGMFLCAFVNMRLDFLYSISLGSLLAAIFIDGMLQGLMYSSMADVWSRWAPVQHRSKYISFTLTGFCIGPMLQKLFSLVTISQKGTDIMVEDTIFKLQAVAAVIFAFAWLLLVKNDPSHDNTLSHYERIILQERLKFLDEKRVVLTQYPWMKILTSQSLWVLNAAVFLNGGSYFLANYSLSSHLTTIISNTYDISYLETMENINTIKYIFIFTFIMTTGCIVDRFRYMNTSTNSKDLKIIVCISFIVQGIITIAYYWFNSAPIELLLFILFLIFSTCTAVAIQVIAIDLSPRYASLLNGIQNSFFYFAITYLETFSFLVEHYSGWPKMIPSVAVIAGIYIIGGLFYYQFGSTQLQSWNDSSKNEHEIEQPMNGIRMSD